MLRFVLFLAALMLVVRADPIANVDASEAPAPPKRIAISFDDAPRGAGAFMTAEERVPRLIRALKDAGVAQAAFYVNPSRATLAHTALIERYVAAGHVIGNHSFSHLHLSTTPAATYVADIDKADDWLKGRAGARPWFRFPFLDEGGPDKAKRDAVRAGLKARGIHNGYVTVDGSDWYMEQLAIEAKKAGRVVDMDALRKLYVETHVQSADFSDALMVRTLGRSPTHVLLLHETDVAALFIGDLVKALRADGWEIVTNDIAYADPVYAQKPDVAWTAGTLAEQLAWEKNLPAPRWYERNDTRIAKRLFDRRVLHEAP